MKIKKESLIVFIDENPDLTIKQIASMSGWSMRTIQEIKPKRVKIDKQNLIEFISNNSEMKIKDIASATGYSYGTIRNIVSMSGSSAPELKSANLQNKMKKLGW